MQSRRVDVAIIGAGTAGLTARRAALRQGASVVMIEDGPYGTTCARVGCMPSKLLIAAADAAYEMRHAGRFGVHAGEVTVDAAAVLARVRAERDRFVGFVLSDVEEIAPDQKLRGRARFVGPTALEVTPVDGGEPVQVEARAVVIASGSSSWAPPVLDGAGDRLLHNDDVFELETLPESMAVIGTGIIGIELGQALHRLGVGTSFFTIDDMIGPMTDPAVKASAQSIFGAELDLHLEVKIDAVDRTDDGIRIRWTDPAGERHEAESQLMLAATGRRPNVADLGLDQAGIELDAKGLPRFDPSTMQCGDTPVFIAGDANNQRPLLHEASDEGHIAGGNAARYPDVEPQQRRFPLGIVFSDPQMAIVGAAHAELSRGEVDFEIGEVDYGRQGRSRVMGKNAGLVRVYGEHPSGRFLGAEMIGPRVEHTAHLLSWAGQMGLGVDEMLKLPFYHPVVEEGIRTALRDLSKKLRKRG
ncbi:MAG: dihydrolipoyl dehydrogenase [Deltaproteobacteria bacterium]|jgi:dihydrolipoamide dehydrogenase|nr:dihydrolipoyl dehydrogenase [Deltaproteobacteria bacterium]MBW2535247.1 dihydrolipoyl dehydrogenase [Deltaproteobacteria bacterium]